MVKVLLDEGLARTDRMTKRYRVNGDTISRWARHKKHPLPAREINGQLACAFDELMEMEGYDRLIGERRERWKMQRPLLPIEVARLLGYCKKNGKPNTVTAQRAMRRSVRWRKERLKAINAAKTEEAFAKAVEAMTPPPKWYIPSFAVGGSYYANRDRVFNLAKSVNTFGSVPGIEDAKLEVS